MMMSARLVVVVVVVVVVMSGCPDVVVVVVVAVVSARPDLTIVMMNAPPDLTIVMMSARPDLTIVMSAQPDPTIVMVMMSARPDLTIVMMMMMNAPPDLTIVMMSAPPDLTIVMMISWQLWKGRWQGNDIIIKVLKIRDWSTRKSRDFNEEYPKLRIFSHPNVLPVLGACQSPPAPHPVLITHWMPYGSLYNVLHEGTNLVVDQCQAVKFALDIARGMAFLHTLEPLIPRHYLNSRSVMIDEDMTARISMADVKLSFLCPGRMYCPAWIAPEALQKRPEDINRRSADMWSFAVLLWELVTREVPFADLSNMEIGMKVSLEGLRPTIPPGISPHICKLMKICMNEDPAKRPKFDMIVPILEKMQDK